MSTAGPQIDVVLYSVFASKKKGDSQEKQGSQSSITPSNFQVSAKLDEESRKDSLLTLSFVVSLNDSKGLVTYEFRGVCSIVGTSTEFSMLMEADRNTVPPILDAIYQRLYPIMFLMAGVTIAPYPQSTALASDMVFSRAPGQSQKKDQEPQAKPAEQPAQRNNKTQPKVGASDELTKTASPKKDTSYKPNDEPEGLEKASESITVTKKNSQTSSQKGKVAVT